MEYTGIVSRNSAVTARKTLNLSKKMNRIATFS